MLNLLIQLYQVFVDIESSDESFEQVGPVLHLQVFLGRHREHRETGNVEIVANDRLKNKLMLFKLFPDVGEWDVELSLTNVVHN